MLAEIERARFEADIARLPLWILLLALVGAASTGIFLGLRFAGGFLLGSIAAYVNLRLIERAVDRVVRIAGAEGDKPGRGTGVWVFIQFAGLLLGSLAILNVSGFSLAAAFCGFLVCPAAAILEIVYELVKYDHS